MAEPRAGRRHCPVRTSYIQPCQGQVSLGPASFPALRGPPRCEHVSAQAYTRSPTRASTTRVPLTSVSMQRPGGPPRGRPRGPPCALSPPSAGPPPDSSQVFLQDIGAVETGHVLPAHLCGLPHLLHGLGLLLQRGAVPLHDLVAPLAVDFVGLDVDGEELDFVIAESVERLEGGQVALVDTRHQRLETHEEAGGGDMERTLRGLVAPCGQPPRGGQLLAGLHFLATHSAGFREANEKIDVLDSRFLLDDVLEQKIAGVRVGALGIDGGAPPRELRDILVVLAGPRAELLAAQLSFDPLLGEGIHAAVLGLDGGLETLAEGALDVAHGGLLATWAAGSSGDRVCRACR